MVELLESVLVVPSKETPKQAIWASDLDLLNAVAYVPTVYFYQSTGDPDLFSPAAMKASLSNALIPFYPLAGRLGVDRDGRTEINCTGEGALFVVARSDCTIDDLGPLVPSVEMKRLLVPSADSIDRDHPGILVMFQLTFFKCGGVCLGTALHHMVVDGISAVNFINAWSDIARGIQVSTWSPPFFDHTLLRARSPPTVLFDHFEYNYKRKPQSNIINTKPQPQPYDTAILGLSKYQLNSLKAKTKARLSTFSVVAAYVWRCACRARRLVPHQETRLYMNVSVRNRVRPPLPPGYVGNAVFLTSIVTTVEEMVSTSVLFGAEKIQSATARLDDEYIRSVIDLLASLELKEMKFGRTLPTTDLQVVSWQGMPIYEADFGWGRPMFMCTACLPFCGIVYIMRSPAGDDGGLSLAVALEPESMVRFKELFYEGLDCVKGV